MLRFYFIAACLLSAPSEAQLFPSDGPHPGRYPMKFTPIVAEMVSETKADTRWGPYEERIEGKYWRSEDGRTRTDWPDGHTNIRDRWNGDSIYIDHVVRIAYVYDGPKSGGDSPPTDSFYVAPPEGWDNLGEDVMEDRKVTGQGGEYYGYYDELWVNKELDLTMLIRRHTETWETSGRFTHIRVEEPPASVFEIPEGYEVKELRGSPY